MSIPRPPIELEGHCSAIVDETLYVLSPGGFQSLPLKKHAKWSKEPSGVKVTGPACVTITPNGDESQASLWVIGGTTNEANYDGIQVYSFAKKTWQSIKTAVPVMQNRRNHSAAWLQDQQAILVYAGSQEDARSWLSSQTFVISTLPPFGIQSFTSDAPPANIPILQPWDSGSVVMVGGSTLNTAISIFSPEGGWATLGTELVTPLNPGARGTLVDGSDGSKVLEVYDANVSPNTVTQIVLLGADGTTARTGQIIGNDTGTKSGLTRRDLTLTNWPPYHARLAPTAKRTDFSVVQDPSGLAVISGGNNEVPVALFNQDSNSWLDAGNFFDAKNQQPLKPTSRKHSTATHSTASSSSSPTLASGASSSNSSHERTLRVLGIILGVLFGIAAIFVIVLFVLRVRKRQKREREGWLEEKSHDAQQTSVGAQGGAFNKEIGGNGNEMMPPPNTPWRQSKNEAHGSLAIITGKFNKRSSNRSTNGHIQQGSGDSTVHLVKDKQPGVDGRETVELADIEKRPGLQSKLTPRQERSDRAPGTVYGPNLTEQDAANDGNGGKSNRSRSSGWSKYFATSAATGSNGLGHIPSAYIENNAVDRDRDPSQHSGVPSSTLVPGYEGEPRKTLDGQTVSHVAMGSPSFNHSRDDLAKRGSTTTTEGQKGLIVDPNRPRSQSDSISSYNRSTTSSARTSEQFSSSGTKPWSPTETTFKIPTGTSFKDHLNSRPPSNDTERRVPSRGKPSPFFMGTGSTYRPSKSPKLTPATPSSGVGYDVEDSRASNVTAWPGHRSNPSADYSKPAEQRYMAANNPALPMPLLSGAHLTGRDADDRESYVTVVPSSYYAVRSTQGREEPVRPARPLDSDLAWLNLGLGSNSPTRI